MHSLISSMYRELMKDRESLMNSHSKGKFFTPANSVPELS